MSAGVLFRRTVPGDAPTVGRPSRLRSSAVLVARNPWVGLSIVYLLLVVVCVVAPGLVAGDPFLIDPVNALQPPSLDHVFGTDELGRDYFARVVHGARLTILTTVVAVLIAFAGGLVFGLLAGYFRGAADTVVSRLVDAVLSIPGLLLSSLVIVVIGAGSGSIAIAIGLAGIPGNTRIMRSAVLSVRESAYVDAAHSIGVRASTIIRRHVLPNSIGPMLALSFIDFGGVALSIAGLSFLGFGAPPPAPEWGSLLSAGKAYIATAPWLTAMPGVVLSLFVLSVSTVGRAFQERRGLG